MTTKEFIEEWKNSESYVTVKTSGSTGKPKEMKADKEKMRASARMTCKILGLKRGDVALLCMNVDYIGAKMMVVRALEAGLKLVEVEVSGHPLLEIRDKGLRIKDYNLSDATKSQYQPSIDFAAMVPMQVYNSLKGTKEERERLRAIKHLIIGGGAIDKELERELQDFTNAVWSTYGMTETLSHIALRRLNGEERSEWYKPLDGVETSTDERGCLTIDAPMVHDGTLVTNDIVEIKEDGSFKVKGRADNVICSGGIKIQIEEVEKALRGKIKNDYAITKRKSIKFGEEEVMMVACKSDEELENIRKTCEETLPKYRQPKEYIRVEDIPRTETGKIKRGVSIKTESKFFG